MLLLPDVNAFVVIHGGIQEAALRTPADLLDAGHHSDDDPVVLHQRSKEQVVVQQAQWRDKPLWHKRLLGLIDKKDLRRPTPVAWVK